MVPSDRRGRGPASRGLWIAATALALGCGPSQIGPDKKAFKAVDALYTAVSLRDEPQVARCEKVIADLRDEGKLPDGAHREIVAVIALAHGGNWEKAGDDLRRFMRGQHD